jgi:formate C-acetyltransferase
VLGYFAEGGMQLQLTCVNKEDMLDALEHPERHENLTVRIGGYSEYFNRLSPELKRTVIERTLY